MIPNPNPEYYTLEAVKSMDQSQLRSITNQDISSPELQAQIAYEILNLPRFVTFPVTAGAGKQLFYGTFYDRNYVPVDMNFLTTNINNFTPYQYMTLMEVDKNLYDVISTYLPKSYFLINETQKEYVNLGSVDESVDFETMTSLDPNKQRIISAFISTWSPQDKVEIKVRPFNYMRRQYRDRTGMDKTSNDLEAPLLTQPYQAEMVSEAQSQLEAMVRAWYPLIDKYQDLPTFLLVEPSYVIPVLFNPGHIPELRYEKESRVAWRPDLLNDLYNPTSTEGPFYEKLSALISYLGTRPIVTIISREGNAI